MQFWSPGDEHMCSEHVEAWNKLILKQKFCASSWLIPEIKLLIICFLGVGLSEVNVTQKKWPFVHSPSSEQTGSITGFLGN